MKKIMSILMAVIILTTILPAVIAARSEDKDNQIGDFRVYKWVSNFAENKVVVYSINGGERGVIVIDITREDLYEAALEEAKKLLNTPPTEYSSAHGTPFAIARVWI